MRKLFLFTVALLCAASMWADETEGPWTLMGMNSRAFSRDLETPIYSLSYNQLDGTYWTDAPRFWNDNDGIGYTIDGSSVYRNMLAVFSTYKHEETVDPYTRKRLTWTFQLGSKSAKHHNTVFLYGMPDNHDALKALVVDATSHNDDKSGAEYLVAPPFTNPEQDSNPYFTVSYTSTFDFDNSTGNSQQKKTWYLMLSFVTGSGKAKSDLYEWGSFKHIEASWQTLYYKHITYHANEGEGTMDPQTIENSGNLTANAFTRNGYAFAGWATTSGGSKAYNDGGAITATSDDKGLVDLYAKWNIANYTIAYDLDGGSVSEANPTSYTMETETFTLNNPTREGYIFLGWTGSNGDVPQMEVSIAQGSFGNKTYTANWQFTTVYLIEAIPNPVVHTDACHDAINAALDSYILLSDEQKALMSAADLEKLQAAVTAYDLLEGKGTIRFVDKDDAIIREHVMTLELPEAPTVDGFTFQYWQVVAKNISDDQTIRLQAVYTKNTPTDIDETSFPSGEGRGEASKLIKDGNLYILNDELIYTINGQRIK